MPAERDEDGKLIQYRGPGESPDCGSCPCARNGKPIKPVRAFGATGGLMVVGEGPGNEEMFQGVPFIGPSGRIISRIFQQNKADRALMWITNSLLCPRPKDDSEFAKAIECCRPRLLSEIPLVQPTAILALGRTAVRALKLPVDTILEARGTSQESPLVPGLPVITTIHPAALLKGGAGETGGGKQKMNVDAQHQFLEADCIKAWRVAMGMIAPAWSDDIEVFGTPPEAPQQQPPSRIQLTPAQQEALTFETRFNEFHARNPHVYDELVKLARQARSVGHKRIGIRMLWETMRFNFTVVTFDPNSDFKLNDHYHSRYARLIVAQEPDLADAFELRDLRST